jgi:peptide/nickel transport system permease protein
MPNFWLGPLLIMLFSIRLGWTPVSGGGDFVHLILPAVTLGMALAGILARLTRSGLLEVLGSPYVRAARAKGAPESRILWIHALRNAMLPVITVMGLQFGHLLAGAIITETVFSWPGVGMLLINAINSRDYPLVQGCVLSISITYVIINLVTDIAYVLVDPRIRYEDK